LNPKRPITKEESAQLADEAVQLCSELIKVDTTNPPGNEWRAAEILSSYLDGCGVATEIVESSPGRSTVIARLEGQDRSAPHGLLLSHLDTSPVQSEFWTNDAFEGSQREGFVWGRGAVDLKSLTAVHAVGLGWLARLGITPTRDLVLLSVADETRGGAAGIRWLENHNPQLLQAAWVLGEGSFSYSSLFGASGPVFTFCPEEKTALWLELEARGPGGHSSIPRVGTAVERLIGALSKMYPAATAGMGEVSIRFVEELGLALGSSSMPETINLVRTSPAFAAMLTDTLNATIVQAGMEPSVVPSVATAVVDCRLLPETDVDEFIARVRDLIDDDSVTVSERFRAVSGQSPIDGELPDRLKTAIQAVEPDALVLPVVSAGYTDLRIFRARGVPAYGCHVVQLTLEDRSRISGHDERIPISGLRAGAAIIHELLRNV
jgi:acetylornithine deacetylase/succinyl-diaminopimelate desuccinylase-like protein